MGMEFDPPDWNMPAAPNVSTTLPTTTSATGIIGRPAQATTTTMAAPKLGAANQWQNTDDQTVAGQIQNLTDPNSPLIQQARSRAAQQANARGLMNSSMALTGADAAAYDVAMPIAQADAAQASRVAGYNVGTGNEFRVRDAETETQVGLANMGAQNQGAQFNAGQLNESAQRLAQQGFDLAKMDRQAALTLTQMTAQQTNDMAQLAAKQGFNLQTMDAEQANTLARMAKEIEANDLAAEKKFGYDKQLVEIQKASNREIASLEAQYKNLTQASASAASIINNVSTNVARIMESTTLDAAAKQKAIDIYNANANKALQMMGAISSDVDLVEFLDEVLNGVAVP